MNGKIIKRRMNAEQVFEEDVVVKLQATKDYFRSLYMKAKEKGFFHKCGVVEGFGNLLNPYFDIKRYGNRYRFIFVED